MDKTVKQSISLALKMISRSSSDSDPSSSEESSSSDDNPLQNEAVTKSDYYYATILPSYSDSTFKAHFRLRRGTVEILFQEMLPHFETGNPRRPTIDAKKALLFSIWLMANPESYRSVSDRFGIARGHSHETFMKVAKIFYRNCSKYITFPKQGVLMNTAREFNELRGTNSFPGVIGCVDGTHIGIPGPRDDNSYYNRKGQHSVVLQGICNAKLEFIDVFCGWPCATHDARVWQNSPIKNLIESSPTLIPENYHLLGDSAYALTNYLMVPFKDNGHLTESQRKFNTRLSSTRIVIEQAFGLLYGRFRRLKLLDVKKFSYIKYYVMFACILHNLCIKGNDRFEINPSEVDLDPLRNQEGEGNLELQNVEPVSAQIKRNQLLMSFEND